MATMLNPNAIPDGSITSSKIEPSVLEGKQDKLTPGDNITIVDSVISATGGGGSVDLSAYAKTEDVNAGLATKQDTISDLATIRSGASKGATALQSYTESDPIYTADKPSLALKTEIPDVSGKADKATTLAGYGIGDAYTKSEVDTALAGKANLQHQHTVADITDFPELYYDATTFFTSGAYPSDKYEELLEAVKAKKTVYATLDEEGNISYVFFMSLANSDGLSSRVLLTTNFADGSFLYLNTFVLQQSGMTRMQENITSKANKATTLAGYGIGDAYTKSEVDASIDGKQDKTSLVSDLATKVNALSSSDKAAFLGQIGAADKTAFETHNNDSTRHITAAERTAWNAKQGALTAGFGISISGGEISSTLDTNPFIVVSSLPSSGVKDKIYIAPSKNPETGNLTDEWIWNGSAWELLGASKVDLSDYATESWVENKGYLTEHQDISGKADVSYVDNKISTLTNVVNGKQDNISDLTAIRNGATLGSTAIQEETDPTVPAWAKAEKKPSYTPSEVGAASQEALQSHTKDAVVHITATERANWNAKQDTISDLAAIRSGASKGATALQSYTETDPVYTADKPSLALKSEIPDISGKANVTDLTKHTGNTNIHVTASDKSAWNSKQDAISDLSTIRSGAALGATALQSYTEKYTGTITGITMNGASKGTSGVVNLGTVITEHQDISGKADKSSLAVVATSGSYNDLSNKPTIPSEQVNADWNATSGKAQILNKPTIPSAVTESIVSGWGFTKNTGTYSKPSTGIPKSDLESAVQTSLGKADTALQSYTEQYKGTVTGVKINGTTKNPSSGVVDLGTVITDISGKQDTISDLATIRSGAAKGATALQSYTETDPVYTADKPNIAQKIAIVTKTSGATSYAISPNKITQLGTLASSVTISLNTTEEETGFINIYDIIFTTPSAAPSITWPEGITWVGGSAPAIAGGKTYEVSIMNGLATYGEF